MHLLSINSFASNTSTDRENFNIDYLSSKDGLSQSEVTSILQDKYGFLWFGTRGGVNEYDGYEFKHFKPSSPINGMISPSTEVMLMDNSNNLWVGTKSGGLCRYNLSTEKFHENDSVLRKLPNRIIALYQDFDSNIWIGTWQDGVYKYNPINDKLDNYLSEQRVSSITQTSDSTMWFGIGNWLAYLKKGKNELERIRLKPDFYEVTEMTENVNDTCLWMVGWNTGLIQFNYSNFKVEIHELSNLNILNNSTYSIHLDEKENLYVGTWGKGLYYYDTKTKISETIDLSNVKNRFPTPNLNVILDIFRDKDGNIWIGTDGSGAVKLSDTKQFNSIATSKSSQIGAMHVNAVFEDNKGRIWIGTRENGLFVTSDLQNFKKVKTKELNQDVLIIKAIHQDNQGVIWIGSGGQYNNLLLVEEMSNGELRLTKPPQFSNFRHPNRLKKITAIFSDNNKIYFGTQQTGLFVFDKKDYGLEFANWFHRDDEQKTFQDNRITSIKPDSYGNIWISTYKGLYLISDEQKTPVNYFDYFDVKDKIKCDIVLSCWPDNKGKIWFGTPCNINFIEYKSDIKHVKSINKEDGLLDEYVNAIIGVEDNIWFSTNSGISKLNTNTRIIHNFNANQGVGDYNFSEGAVAKGKNGNIYFGGYSNLTYFNPADIELSQSIPEIIFTSFKILNKEVSVDAEGFMPTTINDIEHLTINHKQTEFSFSLSVIDYTNPDNNQYGYRIITHKDTGDWIYTGSRRHISFSNLKPGDYILQFIGSNSSNIWNKDGKKIAIKVLPPPWKSWYAIAGYVLIIIGIAALIRWAGIKQEQFRNAIKMEKLSREQEKQMNEYKFGFFTNISHEIRTPLTLIIGPLKELMFTDFSEISKNYLSGKLEMICQNTNRLNNLINQLLEFRKIEAGKLVLQVAEHSLAPFIDEVCTNYNHLATLRNFKYTVKNSTRAKLFFDKERLNVVLDNLLTNAFKYAGEPGVVNVEVGDMETEIFIRVSNNGKGISKADENHIFDRFNQARGNHHMGSSGIGLALVKNYINLHKGKILVESIPNELTTFTVLLKKGKAHLNNAIFIEDDIQSAIVNNQNVNELNRQVITRSLNTKTKGATVLIVEDNKDVQLYLFELLANHFNVVTADNGFDGFEKAINNAPDLIISDVMMPQMDGFELCEKIKSNVKLLHIPVLLLTAKSTARDMLFGTKKGADAYLIKPFEPELLIEKTKQLIASRSILKEKYAQKVTLEPTDKDLNKQEAIFINMVINKIEKQISNPEFDSQQLASEMAMSTSTFYRKIKQITEMAPGEFIKSIKLKRAAQLLTKTNLSVSEIIEEIGFTDAKSFRRNFKEAFGKLPMEYKQDSKGQNLRTSS